MFKAIAAGTLALLAGSATANQSADGKVVVLTPETFDEVIASQEGGVLVKFKTDWCGHCKALAPEYVKAAESLKGKAIIAEVDCGDHRDLCSSHGIKGFPTLKLISKDGTVVEYDDARKGDAISNWVIKQSQPAFVVISTEEELKKFKEEAGDLKVVINTTEDSAEAGEVKKAAVLLRKDADIAIFTGATDNKVTIYRKFDEPVVEYTGAVNSADITAFVKAESLPLVGEIGPQNFMKYIDRNLPLVWVFVDYKKDSEKSVIDALTPVAKKFRNNVVFAKLDGNRWGEHAKTFGLSGATPGIVIEDRVTRKNYIFPESKEITTDDFSTFVDDFTKGKLVANVKSEEIPATNDEPVKIVVGKEYEKIVLDDSKDVFMMYYAEWCGHCKSLKPKWEQLATDLAGETNVVIGKGDATANDYPVDIQGFPTLYFYPAGKKENPIAYNGDRTVEALEKFVREHGTTLKATAEAGRDEL